MSTSKFNHFRKHHIMSQFKNHLNFLLRCKHSYIVPKFINVKCNIFQFYVNKAIGLNLVSHSVIHDVWHRLSLIEPKFFWLHLNLSNSESEFSEWKKCNFTSKCWDQIFWIWIKIIVLCYLLNPFFLKIETILVQNSVIKLSYHFLSNSQKEVLNLGWNFSLSSTVSTPKLIAPMEKSFTIVKFLLVYLIHILVNGISLATLTKNLTFHLLKKLLLKKFIPDLLITKADKVRLINCSTW